MTLFPQLERDLQAASTQAHAPVTSEARSSWLRGRLRGFALPLLAFGACGALGAGVAIGQSSGSDPGKPLSEAVYAPPPATNNTGAAHQTSSAALRAHLDHGSYLAGVDWASARSFAVPDSGLRGWTFRQGPKRCLALPDPVAEGYGVVCRTPADIADGLATVIVLTPPGSSKQNVVGALVSEGAGARLESPSGKYLPGRRVRQVFVAQAPESSRLVVGPSRLLVTRAGGQLKPAPSEAPASP